MPALFSALYWCRIKEHFIVFSAKELCWTSTGGYCRHYFSIFCHCLVAASNPGIAEGETQLQWWKHQTRLPKWQQAAKAVFTLLPSSAPAERAFSLLKAHMSHLQSSLLEVHLEAALMLQFNRGNLASWKSEGCTMNIVMNIGSGQNSWNNSQRVVCLQCNTPS